MRLSIRDRDILCRVTLHADCSLRELAQISKHQLHSVRYLLERMKEAGAIRKTWVIDPLRLGWQRYHLLFSTAAPLGQKRDEFINYLVTLPTVASFAEIGGDFDYSVNVLARNVKDACSTLSSVTNRFGMVFFTKYLSLQYRVAYFPRKYLASGPFKFKPLLIGDIEGTVEVDGLDRRLLYLLARNPDCEKKELAKLAGSSVVTVTARIEKLRENKIIRGASFVQSGAITGAQNYRLLIYARGINESLNQTMFKYAEKAPHCTSYSEGFGGADFELGIEVEHYNQVVELKEDIRSKFGDQIAQMQVLSRFKVHKYSPYPFDDANIKI